MGLRLKILFIVLACTSLQLDAQEIGLNWLQSNQVFNGRNSAVPYPKKTVIGLPDISGTLFNESGGFQNWITDKTVSLENFWLGLERKNYTTSVAWSGRSLFFGKKYKKFQWGISHSIDGESNFKYNKDLVGLFTYGNYGLLEKEPILKSQALSITPVFNTTLYQSIGIETGIFINDQFSIGAGVKYISGFFNTVSDIKQFDLDIRDPFTIKANENWTIQSANFINSLSFDSTTISRNQIDFGKHPGVAFTVGIFHSDSKIKAGAQLRDIGFIHWDGDKYSRSGVTTYSGIRVNDLLTADKNIFNQITDTLKNLGTVQKSASTYRTSLRSKFIADVLYDLNTKFSIGVSVLYRFNFFDPYWKIAAGTVFSPSKIVHLGSQLSFDRYDNINIGLFGALNVSAVRFYGSIDHIPVLINPEKANRFSGNVGLAVMW